MFKLIDLPYKSLAHVISDETLSFHHGKHLQTYVDNLNKLIAGTPLENASLERILEFSLLAKPSIDQALFNNAGQVLNHELYFLQFTPNPHRGLDPRSPLAEAIAKQWGNLDTFKAEFEAKGVSLFGSGWVWLQANAQGELSIAQYTNADNPIVHGFRPLLTFDVWEHAYYLDYQNRRAAHLQALWQIVNWEEIEARYLK